MRNRSKESSSSISFAYFIMPTNSHSFRATNALGTVTLLGSSGASEPADPDMFEPLFLEGSHAKTI